MRKLVLLFLVVQLAVSCGVASLGRHKAKSPAQIFAEDVNRTEMRAWGSRTGQRYANLEAYAAAVAKAALAREICDVLQSTLQLNGVGVGEDVIKSAADETIIGSRVVMSDRYVNRDGTETCYAAVMIRLEDVLRNIRNSKKIQDVLEEAAGGRDIDVRSDKFEEDYKASFAKKKENDKRIDTSVL